MHAGELLGDRVLRPVLLLRQPLDPPDLRTCDFARPLKEIALARWGFVDLEKRQREEGHKFWYNSYWKTKPTGSERRPIGKLHYQAQGVLYLPESARFSNLIRLPEVTDI